MSNIAEFVDLDGGGPVLEPVAATPTPAAPVAAAVAPTPAPAAIPLPPVAPAPIPVPVVPLAPPAPTPVAAPAPAPVAVPAVLAVQSPAVPPAPITPEEAADSNAAVEEADYINEFDFEDGGIVCTDGGGLYAPQGVLPPMAPVVNTTKAPEDRPIQSPAPAPAPSPVVVAAAPAPVYQPAPQQATAPVAATTAPEAVTDFMAAAFGSPTPPPAPASQPPAPVAAPVPPAAPVAVTPPAPISPPAPPPQPTATTVAPMSAPTTGGRDNDINDTEKLRGEIAAEMQRLRVLSGVMVMVDPRTVDQRSVVHQAIHAMYHNPVGLVGMTVHDLNMYEAALSAHQVYMQSVENEWEARYQFLGREKDRLLRRKRGQYKADTEKAKEEAVLDNEPAMQRLHNDFLKAQAIATFMRGMGERFAQLEDGLKRTIHMRQDEETRQRMQQKWTA